MYAPGSDIYDNPQARVAAFRSHKWRPGQWGSWLTVNSGWSAMVDEESLRIGNKTHAIQAITEVRLSQGLIWASVSIEHEGGRRTSLGGLTNENASEFVKILEDACVLKSISRLKNLLPAAEASRAKWRNLAAKRRWLTRSEFAQFIKGCRGSNPVSDLGQFLRHKFIEVAKTHLSSAEIELLDYLHGANLSVDSRNLQFLNKELSRNKRFFDTVEKNPLTDEQRRAVITFDDNVMTVAAAGSGKTSVLIAKAGYAVAAGLFKPEQIVLLAFNRRAADELAKRVKERLGTLIEGSERIKATTFHALGLEIIATATGKKPTVASWVGQERDIPELVDIVQQLSTDNRAFAGKWNLFKAVFARPLSSFDAEEEPEHWDPKTKNRGFRTLRGETVKSREERMICDWLATKGVKYKYEHRYEHDTATVEHSQYQPDFYYPSVGVYHEHFALNNAGQPPRRFKDYMAGVHWKRDKHAKMGTKLIETTSFGIRSAGGFQKLEDDLRSAGVPFDEVPLTDENLRPIPEDAKLLRVFRTFMSHVKSNQLSMAKLRARAGSDPSQHPGRDRLFLDIFEALWGEWEKRLVKAGAVDFEDMLGQAVEHLAAGRAPMPYRLVMADEFQDSSHIRGALLKQLTGGDDARLYVVGDDWQAVNRFAGADISLMQDFKKHIGPCETTELTQTFRCPADICKITSEFIMKNPYQLKKTVHTKNRRAENSVFCFQIDDMNKQENLLRKHLKMLADNKRKAGGKEQATALVLGRYGHDKPKFLKRMQDEISDVVSLRFSTIHAAKGLEADYIFLVSVIEGTRGMPSKIEDDSVLWMAMPYNKDFLHDEERRLFYVALTRAKQMVFIYTDQRHRSEFIVELQEANTAMQVRMEGNTKNLRGQCRKCRLGVLDVRRNRERGNVFLGCSRFPRCGYTETIQRRRPKLPIKQKSKREMSYI